MHVIFARRDIKQQAVAWIGRVASGWWNELSAENMLEREQAEELHQELLRRIAGGESQAIAELYDSLSGPLFSLAIRILGDATEAEDVIQEVFVQIWQKAVAFDPRLGSAFQWCLGIARNRSIDRLRSRQRRARLIEGFQQERRVVETPEPNQAVASAWVAEEATLIRTALNDLPLEQREAIEMAFFGGNSHVEIAEKLGQPLGTIKARIRRGMLKLRDSLQAFA